MADVHREQQFDFQGYLHLLWKRKWLIGGFTVALTAAVGVGTYYQPKVYQAKVTLLSGRESPRLLTADPIPGERIGQRDYLKTQAAILSSRSLLEGAVRRLMKAGFYGKADAALEAKSSRLAGDLQQRVKVQTADDTQVITVVVVGAFPDRVAQSANAIADQYVDSNEESRVSMANQAVAWLTTKLAEQRTKLAAAEEDLRVYKDKEKIVAPDDADPFSTLNLSRLNDEYLTTRFQRMEKQTRLSTMKKNRDARSAHGRNSATGSLDAEIQRKLRESLETEYVQAQVDLKNLSQRYGPEHPDIITLKEKVDKIAKELDGLGEPAARPESAPVVTETQISDLQAEVSALTQKEAALSEALEAHKAQARTLSRTGAGYTLRKQAVDLNRQTYNDLLTRLNEAQLSSQIKAAAVKVLDRAEPPRSPIEPQPARNLIVAILLGLVLGVGLATFTEVLDRRIKNPEEAVHYLRLPLLTVVPGFGLGRNVGKEEGKAKLVTLEEPKSHAAECYRNLRTSILFSTGHPVPKTILVTSAVGGEGKSTTAVNLAVVMSQNGKKVLLIDADLRRPSLTRYFARRGSGGIVRLLKESCRPEEAVQRSYVDNLDLLLCHDIPGNPSELLGSKRMLEVIEHFRSHYEAVVIDSPVIISVPDTLILASRAEAVILVHRPGAATRDMIRHARERLDEVKSNILGLVLNNVDLKSSHHGYSQHRYYGYGIEDEVNAPKGRAGKKA
jgi:capsular exopolysaccharide synthesis family protein